MRIKTVIFIFFTFICLSCKKDKDSPPSDLGYSYIPVDIGRWNIYSVDSTALDAFTKKTKKYNYQLKEIIESVFLDNQGRETQRIERYIRRNENENWQIADVWYANKTFSTYEKAEENIRFIKLSFPVSMGLKWNGNAYNEYPSQEYKYSSVNDSYSINGFKFDSTVTVLQQQEQSSLVSGDFAYEIYAKNTGLIYKKFYEMRKANVYGDTLQFIDYTYKIIAYGKN